MESLLATDYGKIHGRTHAHQKQNRNKKKSFAQSGRLRRETMRQRGENNK